MVSTRQVVTIALLAAHGAVLPLAGIAYFRFFQARAEAPKWARLAQASRWLSHGAVCDGAASSTMAGEDLRRWRSAVDRLSKARGPWLEGAALDDRLEQLARELDRALRDPEEQWAHAVRSRCAEARNLAELTLARAIDMGVDPSSRADRSEDLGIRDVTVFLGVWIVFAALSTWLALRLAVVPAQRIARVAARIAEGDFDTPVPKVRGEAMEQLADALAQAVQRFVERERLKSGRVIELRDLVRRLIELLEQPVLVVGRDERLHYVNPAAAEAFGQEVGSLEGNALEQIAGGEAIREVAHGIFAGGTAQGESVVSTNPERTERHVARTAVVRDRNGDATRVVMVLRPQERQEGAWWKQLWERE